MQDASDLYNADYAQTEDLFRRLLASSAGAPVRAPVSMGFHAPCFCRAWADWRRLLHRSGPTGCHGMPALPACHSRPSSPLPQPRLKPFRDCPAVWFALR